MWNHFLKTAWHDPLFLKKKLTLPLFYLIPVTAECIKLPVFFFFYIDEKGITDKQRRKWDGWQLAKREILAHGGVDEKLDLWPKKVRHVRLKALYPTNKQEEPEGNVL